MCEPDFQRRHLLVPFLVQRDRLVRDLVRRSRPASTTGRPARRGRRRRCSGPGSGIAPDAVHERRRRRPASAPSPSSASSSVPTMHQTMPHTLRMWISSGNGGAGRNRVEREERRSRSRGSVGQELAVRSEHARRLLDRPERRAADDVGHRVRLERELGDDAEVAAAAAQRPEQVAFSSALGRHAARRRRGRPRAASRLSIVRPYPRVRWPMPPPSVRPPTPVVEMIPHGTARPCVVRGLRRPSPQVQPPPTRAVRASGSTDTALHLRQVDDDAVVDAAETAAVVAAAADRDRQVVLRGRSAIAARDVVGARAARDQPPGACRSSR